MWKLVKTGCDRYEWVEEDEGISVPETRPDEQPIPIETPIPVQMPEYA